VKRLLLSFIVALTLSLTPTALPGVQPVVVIYATRNAPSFTIEQVRTNALGTARMVEESSYGLHTLDVQAFGPFQVPLKTSTGLDSCRDANAYGKAAEDAARIVGVVFQSGVQPWIHSDCGHQFTLYTSSIPGAKRGLSSDGKMQGFLYGLSIGLPVAYAEVMPYTGTNPFDLYTPMGYMPQGGFNAHERWNKGWIAASQVRADDEIPSGGTQFIETTEKAPSGGIKLWRLSNGIEIDVRNFGLSQPTKRPPSIVTLHRGSLLDLDQVNPCRDYTLLRGQIYTVGDGLGIRTESLATDGSGAVVSVFPYRGPITARCAAGSK
jgi:hypothetical protein